MIGDETADEEKAREARLQEKLQMSLLKMQTVVNTLYDFDLDKLNTDTPMVLKQVLE